MNYQKVYNSIIENAKIKNRKKLKKNNIEYAYYENHHILPKCLNGGEESDNKVLLTAREHYICHKLLTYIYKGNRKIASAFHYMTYSKNENYNKSSKDYEYARELISSIPMSKEHRKNIAISNTYKLYYKTEKFRNTMKTARIGFKHSEESKQKIKEKRKLQENENLKGWHHSEESKLKNSNSHKGKISNFKGKHHSKEAKKKLSESSKLLIGDKNSFYGKHHTKETIEKNRQTHLGKIHSKYTKEKINNANKGKIPWNKGLKYSWKNKNI